MQYTIRFFFSFIFLCVTISTSLAGVTASDSLFAQDEFFEASIEYERQIFELKHYEQLPVLRYKKALCYKYMGEFARAAGELQQAYFANPADTLYRYAAYEQALCLYLNGEPQKALWKIDEFLHRTPDSVLQIHFLPLKILCLNSTYRWDEAALTFKHFAAGMDLPTADLQRIHSQIDDLYCKKNIPKVKKRKRAENWSRFIPGSGQMYAGKVGEGALNFLIQASLLTFSAFEFYNGFYFTGYLVGLGFFNKIYQGGIVRAGNIAANTTNKRVSEFNHRATALLIQMHKLQN